MTVVNPKSISGINSITMASGSDNLLTIHTTNTTERVRINSSGDVIVGSGITVSPDGDIFATGVCTATSFSGSLAASNLTGALPAISGANLTGIDTDLVSDTSPQLGGNLASNGNNINIADSTDGATNRITFGSSGDLQIYHDGSNSRISDNGTGNLILDGNEVIIQSNDNTETQAKFISNGAVELYYNDTKRIETTDGAMNVSQGSSTFCNFHHDGGHSGIRIAGPSASSGANLVFANNYDSSNSDEWAIQLDGATDDLVFVEGGAQGTNRVRFLDSGGICFGTDTATANALDDYEEGTFTAGWFDDGGAFATYSTQYGQYTKIGNVVYFCVGLRINTFTRTPNSGQICRVGNLPFVSREVGDDEEVVFNLYARLWGSGTPPEAARIRQSSGSGSNHIEFYMDESQTGNDDALYGSDFDTSATCRVIVNGFYYTS